MKKFITICLIFAACFVSGCGTARKDKPVHAAAHVQLKVSDGIDEQASDNAWNDGLVAYAQGNNSEAKKDWELALRYNPENEKARKALERLKKEMEFRK
jgi:Tfp pilus assembly protein PilF